MKNNFVLRENFSCSATLRYTMVYLEVYNCITHCIGTKIVLQKILSCLKTAYCRNTPGVNQEWNLQSFRS